MKLRELARRRGGKVEPTSPLALFLDEPTGGTAGYAPVWLDGVRSFYDYLHEGDGAERICAGTACHSTVDRILAVVPPVTAFVAAVFEHSGANMHFC